MIIHCQQSRTRVCVRSASGFLRYLSAIVEDPFLIWAKCERNESASSLQDMAKKICPHTKIQIMSALCDNPRILSLPSPCHVQNHSHSGIVGGMGSRHIRYMKALLACDIMWRFDVFVLSTSQGDKSRWQKWLRVACLTPAEILSSFVRQSPGCRFGAFWVCGVRISVMQGVTASVLFSCTFCIRIRHLIRSA